MRYKEHQEKLTAIYTWLNKMRNACAAKRNRTTDIPKKAMLGGKTKAYADTMNLIEGRYGKDLLS